MAGQAQFRKEEMASHCLSAISQERSDQLLEHNSLLHLPSSLFHHMRLLALTDVHDSFEVMESIIASESLADVIILGGDITTNGSQSDMTRALSLAEQTGKKVIAVCGNMDPPPLEDILLEHDVSINARGVIFGDVGFFGVSAAPVSFLHTPNEITEEEIARRAELGWQEASHARWRIFVPHAPPSGSTTDKTLIGRHVGSTAVRKFIEERQPDVVVCGHIHEARGQDVIGETKVVNCGAAAKGYYAVIEVGGEITINNQQLTVNSNQ